jgi:hypothetical protein
MVPPRWSDEQGRPLAQIALAARAIIFLMPAPTNERQALEREQTELPEDLAANERELAARAPADKPQRERLAWHIHRVQKRMAEIEVQLTALRTEK